MSQNPPDLRPDLAHARVPETPREGQPTIGMVSLGCPKALVDSERILTRLRAEGYAISPDYTGAEANHTLAFAEHMRRGAPWREAYFDEVECLAREFAGRLRIVCGIEARVLNPSGCLDTDDEALERAELVVAAVMGLAHVRQPVAAFADDDDP